MSVESVRAGKISSDIEVPLGIPMVGFAGRGPADAVHDRLKIKALSLESGANRAILIAADLLWFPARLAREVREEISRATGVPVGSIFLCASHTHYGSSMGSDDGSDTPPIVLDFLAHLKGDLVGLAQMS